ncbi:hypothetical protein Har1130_06720 [Haloarcula sp. CBA1130]|uniref:hypothetical protein n=1 Tax=unclassified Haloarcula TaxID=2624677 RepID=UPI001246BBF6|nr:MULTISPECIES: hypothetical protein [unclassified Haloarcula]KAA9397867.1 hypothetical protein Har1129_06420 [Haloarcula sp. CBA1129]KAA9402445.1 hypothetical protein Har1130_06720 [Haloarcula sp. CBA1130]
MKHGDEMQSNYATKVYEHLQAMATHGFADSQEINKGHRQGRHLEFDLAIGIEEALDALEQESRFSSISETLYNIRSGRSLSTRDRS